MLHAKCGYVQTSGMKEKHQRGIHSDLAVIYQSLSVFYVSPSQFHRPFLFYSLSISSCLKKRGGQAAFLYLPAVATKTGTKYVCPLC